MRDSVAAVALAAPGEGNAAPALQGQRPPSPMYGVDLTLPLGSGEGAALRVLRPYDSASVLALRGMRPGAFGGFDDAARNARFDAWFLDVTR